MKSFSSIRVSLARVLATWADRLTPVRPAVVRRVNAGNDSDHNHDGEASRPAIPDPNEMDAARSAYMPPQSDEDEIEFISLRNQRRAKNRTETFSFDDGLRMRSERFPAVLADGRVRPLSAIRGFCPECQDYIASDEETCDMCGHTYCSRHCRLQPLPFGGHIILCVKDLKKFRAHWRTWKTPPNTNLSTRRSPVFLPDDLSIAVLRRPTGGHS